MEIVRENLTAKEAQKIIGCGTNKIYELIHRDDFPSFFIGKKAYINRKKLFDWMEVQCEQKTK